MQDDVGGAVSSKVVGKSRTFYSRRDIILTRDYLPRPFKAHQPQLYKMKNQILSAGTANSPHTYLGRRVANATSPSCQLSLSEPSHRC